MAHTDPRFRISIRNWDKHQRPMRGEGKRQRRRDWYALSTDISRDPDVIALTAEQRWLWVALLAQAGRFGPDFEIQASVARALFSMRKAWKAQHDFERLQERGFISFEVLVEGEPAKKRANRAKKEATSSHPKPAPEPQYPEGLNVEAWKEYLQYRRESKLRRYTKTGALRAMNKWAKYPKEVQAAAVATTIENNWHGVFPEREANEKGKGRDSFDKRHARAKARAGLD